MDRNIYYVRRPSCAALVLLLTPLESIKNPFTGCIHLSVSCGLFGLPVMRFDFGITVDMAKGAYRSVVEYKL